MVGSERYLTLMRAQPGWENILERYGVTGAMVPPGTAISAALADTPGWSLAYPDGTATVYVRTG